MKIKEFVRVYEDGTIAYRVGKKITQVFDPYRVPRDSFGRLDKFTRFCRFCVIAYSCLEFERVDRRFKPPRRFVEIPFLKAVEDYEKLMEVDRYEREQER